LSHKQEFLGGGRYLFASTLGMAIGIPLNHYTMSLFAPEMIAEFGWSRAQFALIGATTFVSMLFVPFAGRFIDLVGPRIAAAVGFTSLPLSYLAISMMTGDFRLFFALTIFKTIFGVLTATMVFARVVVERFDHARGLALSIMMTGAPLSGAIAVPIVAEVVETFGWRGGFQALALISGIGGLIVVLMLGRRRGAPKPVRAPLRMERGELAALVRNPVFLLSMGGMFLVNLPQSLAASQLKLLLTDNGAPVGLATWIISLYAAGVAVGRILSGLALDRIAVHKVAIAVLGFPALGLAVLASPMDGAWALAGAVLIIGLAQGAEGDIGAYLVSRKFALKHYSLLMSFIMAAMTVGGATGSLILSYSLHETGGYETYLLAGAATTLVGAFLFYATGRYPAGESRGMAGSTVQASAASSSSK
jgi:predicted MFS family arabinose efflux permease